MKTPTLSIVILNYKTPRLTLACLKSVFKSKTQYAYEVLVLDNNSGDDSVRLIRKHFPQVRVLAEKKNHGFARGNNLAVCHAAGEYMLFLNSDTKLYPDTLEKAVTCICRDPQTGVLGVTLLNRDLSVQRSVYRFPSWSLFLADLFFLPMLALYDDYRYFGYNRERKVDFVSGAFMLIPRRLFRRVGGFDERFFMYAEETDLCRRISRCGFSVRYTPETKVIHYGGGSGGQIVPGDVFHQSKVAYIRKHLRCPRCACALLAVGALLRACLMCWRARPYLRLAAMYGRETLR